MKTSSFRAERGSDQGQTGRTILGALTSQWCSGRDSNPDHGLDRAKVQEAIARGELDGVVGLGGSTGLSLVVSVMRELPMFLPKFAVTTVITEASSIIAGADIVPVWSISDLAGGERVNAIEAEVLNRVAVVASASPAPYTIERHPTVLATQFGNGEDQGALK